MPRKKSEESQEEIEFIEEEIDITEEDPEDAEQSKMAEQKDYKREAATAVKEERDAKRDAAKNYGVSTDTVLGTDPETGETIFNMKVDSGGDPAAGLDPDPQLPEDLTPEQVPLVDAVINSWRLKYAVSVDQLDALRKELKDLEGQLNDLKGQLRSKDAAAENLTVI